MPLEKLSGCKVNLLLNILGKRPDGFHELETVMYPLPLHDRISFERAAGGIQLTCSEPTLPTGPDNLVFRAAEAFFSAAKIDEGVKLHLEKRIPLAAGLGGGSANAATTLLGLNELFGGLLPGAALNTLAAGLGSDVPFFLQSKPALASGRGEKVQPLDSSPALSGKSFLLIHPGFGISTAWAYQNLARFPHALNGKPGRAKELASALQRNDAKAAARLFYNSLEAPAFEKYPILVLYQEFLREQGALGVLMSGSGSTTFALFENSNQAEKAAGAFQERFGTSNWMRAVTA
jgi:4-diphosphocytidyl-2-C-methyl-D-erythritol kinase